MWSGGSRRRCNTRTARWSTGIVEPRRGRRSPRCWLTCSCITRSTRGWSGSSRPSGSNGIAMMRWCTATANAKPARCGTRSLRGWRRSVWSYIQTRRASSTARTRTEQAPRSTRSSRSWGYEFRPRLAKNRHGKHFVSFLPAVSTDAMKAMGAEIRSWSLGRRSDKSLDDLAVMFNSIVQGWINYYGRFYKSRLLYFLRRLNQHLVRWATRKYHKRLRNKERRAMAWLAEIARRSPRLFAHWRLGARPDGWAMGAG